MPARHVAVVSVVVLAGLPVAHGDAVLEEVLAADRAFAARSAEAGAQSAFLEYLAPDAVLFRPTAVNGADWLRTHEEASGRLDWSPATGRASCDGELAVTVGPWTYRQDTATDAGYYLTLWRRRADGWQVVLDHGVDAPAPVASRETVPELVQESLAGAGECGAGAVRDLLEADAKLNHLVRDKGLDASLRLVLAPQGIALRDAHAPAPPDAQWPADGRQWRGGLVATTRGTYAAPGSDLGYSYGDLYAQGKRGKSTDLQAVFIRVWLRIGHEWRVLADMTTAVPGAGTAQ